MNKMTNLNPNHMKISRIKTNWIKLLSFAHCFTQAIRVILLQKFSHSSRKTYDKCIYNWAARLLNLAKIQRLVVNLDNIQPQPGQATIIMCNHSSTYDIPLCYQLFPEHSMRMLAKKELSSIPFFGSGMKACEFPFIDRKNRHQALLDLAKVREMLQDGIVIWMAPEGTRSKTGELIPFKKGGFITAIEMKATIIPVGIRGAYRILESGGARLTLNQTAEMHVGQPIDASKYTLQDKEKLMHEVYEAIEKLAGFAKD